VSDTDYTTLALVKDAILPSELSPSDNLDETIQAAIPVASRAIDGICGQFFYLTGDETNGEVRKYTATRPFVLDERHRLDPVTAIDSIDIDRHGTGTFDVTLVDGTDYVLEPANNALHSKPYEEIRIHPRSRYVFPCWPQAVRITGRFGWPAVPEGVKAAAQLLSAEIVKLPAEAPLGFTLGHIPGIDAAAAIRLARSNPKVMGYLQNENLIRFPVLA